MDQQQLQLPMLTWYEGPQLVASDVVRTATSYRDAVRACWNLRTRRNLTRRQLAEETGMLPSHISDYLHDDPERRDMPAKYIKATEAACGNRFISQWIAWNSELPVLEVAQRRTA